ncbi:MAG TPA: LysE family translocator [Paraburkholderia sp.]|jgi:threonine/homoserine/homoserine lactone efflux protein|nr:LysE family translocator [Paraburkholderia sp.]
MTASTLFSANAMLAYTAYFIGTASPGPSNLAIMSVAANRGRRAASVFALGVVSGSMCWATVAALGLSAALIACAQLLVAIKIAGGLYLLWLALKSARAAWSPPPMRAREATPESAGARLYLNGVLMHLTNPKAIFVWMSIVSLSSSRAGVVPYGVIPCCAAIGSVVFVGYALLFSTDVARRLYRRFQRAMNALLAVAFASAGLRLLAARG